MSNHSNVPVLYFDGQYIDVLWDNHNNVIAWLEKHFSWKVQRDESWKVDPRCIQGRMTNMNCGTWVVSYITKSRLPHHFAERGTVEPNIRLCFRVNDLVMKHNSLVEDGVRVSSIYSGPGHTRYFDIWATSEAIRLTLQEDPSLQLDELLPSWVRVGVSNLHQSIQWYQEYMGMSFVADVRDEGYALMKLKLNHLEDDSLWVIEQLPTDVYRGKVDGQVQPICWINNRDDFFKYRQYLIERGVETSEVGGFTTKGLVSFHFYDLDGNRFNISSM